ncbi:hypothetical protein QQP08_016491 [Theobroma cacao]|nr:hypothetical protein QQP08_016491 [Theobroma cacao]
MSHRYQPKNTQQPGTFPISSLEIGSWKKQAGGSVILTAGIQFGWQNIVWEIIELGQKRISFKWTDIEKLKVFNDGGLSGLAIKLNYRPKFSCCHGNFPNTRKSMWITTEDFTDGEAERQWHIVKCSPMAIEKYVQRLLQADSRLLGLSIEGSAATGFNQNENQNLEERVCYNVDASPSHTTTNSLQQQIQSSGLTSPSKVNGSENKSFNPVDIYKVDFDYDLGFTLNDLL